MATVTLSYDQFEEADTLNEALNGWKYRAALSEVDNFLRNQLKHGEHSDEVDAHLQKVRDQLYSALDGLVL